MTSELGPLLRRLRREAGMTQEELNRQSGVSVRTIRRLETSTEENFRLDTIRLIADALKLIPEQRRALMSAAGTVPPAEPGPVPTAVRPPLAEVTDRLADVLQRRWRREVEQRGAHNPFPLPVRWHPVPGHLADHWDNVRGVPPGDTADPLDLTGDLTRIAEVYRRVPSGRLVVLGRAGSGKTILTLRFVLDYLATRTAADPVPVIFSLGSWDPTEASLRDWLIGRLLRDHPDLVAATPGSANLAAALVESGRVLPVLDGFDEIPEVLHRDALLALNATSLPMLLTSRPGEYRTAVAATDVLTWAAGIWIDDLTPADMDDYLRRSSRTNRWDKVLAELRDGGDDPARENLAEVLRTPLMVVLARTIYRDKDPAALLDITRFPTSDDLEDHLLGSFVPTAYRPHSAGVPRPHWTPDRVQRWLGYLAHHVTRLGSPDLAWWQLGDSLGNSSRILGVVLASAAVTTLVDWLILLPLDVIKVGFPFGLEAGLLDGLLIGPLVGLGFGLVYGLMTVFGGVVFQPSYVQMRLLGRNSQVPMVRTFTGRFGSGLLGGCMVGLGYGSVSAVVRGTVYGLPSMDVLIRTALINMLVSGAVFGLAAGIVFGLVAALETPLDLNSAASPLTMLRANRTTVIRQVLALAPALALAITFGGTLVVASLQGLLGPLVWGLGGLATGVVGGLSGALSYALAFTAWGQWLVLSRVWLPVTGKLPWSVPVFLDDAYHRGVLRQTGAVYQFRHARFQDHLARTFRQGGPDGGSSTKAPAGVPDHARE
ncbi:helix-turn-helix domain-containing protein [Amycolatopsis pigmentata]|uniref:Helix-turn-helix domain-containing protein n=1 Tax=Amycolatopsis pigmentata TaxID=450801 RepID=A0ABW5G1D7_9PSEU